MEQLKRGDIYFADLNPVVGSEQGGQRPVLILQNDIGNVYSPTTVVAAITSSPKKPEFPTHVPITTPGLEKDSVVLLEQIRALDRQRLSDYIGKADIQTMKKVEAAIRVSLSLKKHKEHKNMFSINGTGKAWVFTRQTNATLFGNIADQEEALTYEAKSEGYRIAGISRVHSSITTENGQSELADMLKAAEEKKIDAVFVFSILHISPDYDISYGLVDKLNSLGIIVYDNEGYDYSYDWWKKNRHNANKYPPKKKEDKEKTNE